MARVAGQGPAQGVDGLALRGHAASRGVRQRHDPVHLGIVPQGRRIDVPAEMVGHGARHRGRTVDRGQDADVIARRHASVGTAQAHEHVPPGIDRTVPFPPAELVFAMQVDHVQVMDVDVLSGLYVATGHADGLAVPVDGAAGGDRPGSQLVAGRHQPPDLDVLDPVAGHELLGGDQDIVRLVQADDVFLHVCLAGSMGRTRRIRPVR